MQVQETSSLGPGATGEMQASSTSEVEKSCTEEASANCRRVVLEQEPAWKAVQAWTPKEGPNLDLGCCVAGVHSQQFHFQDPEAPKRCIEWETQRSQGDGRQP